MSLIAVGTVAFDAIETPFGKTDKVVGGAATYITLAANYFVKKSNLISVIGDDFPNAFLADMESRGISQDGLQVKEGEKSFFWSGKYHYDLNSRDTLVTELNVLADFKPVVPESYQGCEYLMLGNLDPNVQMSVINQLNDRPKLVVLDTMNFWMDIALEPLKEVIAKVDVLTINDEEARQLTGEHSLVKAAQMILNMGPKYLIIKKGEHGALLFDKEQVFFAPALPLEVVVDPTGAGDTFAGGFIGYLAHTGDLSFQNLKRAVIIGSAMASFTCEAFGPERLLSLTTDEIDNRIQKFVDLVDFDILLVE
ncbi:MAG: PfkB family carbohydrate kinase [Flavobacteriales bacterium]|nr:PfkB family carbohydrate kinase [Flavobacteriales bacterium]MDG1779350.1 PfkB family carbohydrate kinase [Flavobacteriales bacterium]MDG2246295.1 PfkB family carbohydrate kinase [Flavobacteriales bacterium]